MHNIQRKILHKLLYAEALNYAQMRPTGVESNHFAYHLDQLVKAGLVEKCDRRYSLTPPGLAHVDRLSQAEMVDRLQPHIVTAIDITNDDGQTLFFKRKFQPYIHKFGFPLGKLHFEERIQDAATRELQEKTGLIDVPLAHRGIAYIEAKMKGFTVGRVLYHIFQGKVNGTPAPPPTQRGECVWADDTTLADPDLMPGVRKVKKLLATHGDHLFFTEISEELC